MVLGLRLGLAFGALGLGLAGQVLALTLADAVKLRYINSNILTTRFNYDCPSLSSSSLTNVVWH